MSRPIDVLVLGGGLDELVAAGRLARRGRRVVVLVPGQELGGACVTEEFAPGFRADTVRLDPGYVSPGLLRELSLDASRVSWADGGVTALARGDRERPLYLPPDPAAAAQAIRSRSSKDADRWTTIAERLARFANVLERIYLKPAPLPTSRAAGDVLDLVGHALRVRGLGRRDMIELVRLLPMPVADLVDEWLEDPLLQGTLAAAGLADLQQGPRSGGTAFVLLHRQVGRPAGTVRGVPVVRGGLGSLAVAAADAARRHGADVRMGAPVARILDGPDGAEGVVLMDGTELSAKTIVSGLGVRKTLLRLADAGRFDPDLLHAVRCIRHRGVRARVLLALGEAPRFRGVDEAGHRATLSVAPSVDYLERAYDAAKYGKCSGEPWLEAVIPTLRDPEAGFAPPGRHVLSVAVQYAPYALRGGWTGRAREDLGDSVVKILGELAPNLPGAVLHRHVLAPVDLERDHGLDEGHPLDGELGLDQVLFMRPVGGWARHRTPMRGLYLTGPGTHPGGGVAGMAGEHAARAILADRR